MKKFEIREVPYRGTTGGDAKMNLDYVKINRGLGFVKIGMKVENTYLKKVGIIKGGNRSGNLDILFEGEKKVKNCHPTWAMKYYDDDGKLIKEFSE